jgi:sterol desaturase/sphingolipid hydroxylase (fatty acid hydroxylase superfamily)
MLHLYELYQGWLTFWCTYFLGSLFFPSSKAVSRPSAKITLRKLMVNLAVNTIATALAIPLIYMIPPLIEIPAVSLPNYILRYGALFVLSDIWFYYMHRLMHHKYFYCWHKDHHAFIHPYALAGLYCSPVEMIIVNQLSVSIPMQMLGYTYNEIIFFTVLIALNILKGHSGLQLYLTENKWSHKLAVILFGNKMHDLHHELLNVNYGSLYLMDFIHSTHRVT